MQCEKRCELGVVIEDIATSICCSECCSKFKVSFEKLYAGCHRLPSKLCKKTYKCSDSDLSTLNHCILYYPKTKKTVKFYLGAEVRCLSESMHETTWKMRVKRKRKEVEDALDIPLKKLNRVLRSFTIEDYTQPIGDVKFTLTDIEQRYAVYNRVKQMRKECPLAHPQALFDFCIRYPKGTASDFQELKEKIRQVFYLEGDRIIRMIAKKEREKLLETPLKDIVESFESRDKRGNVKRYLERWVSREMAERIVDDPACQMRLEREENEFETAQKLLQFWNEKNDYKQREQNILKAYDEKGIVRPRYLGSAFGYISGSIDCDTDIIIGLYIIRNHFPILHPQRSERIPIAMSKFEESYYEDKLSFKACIGKAVKFGLEVPLPDPCREDSTEMLTLASGYWSKCWYLI